MDSMSVSSEEKHRPEYPVLDASPAPFVHGGARRVVSRTGLKIRCWMLAQHRLFTAVLGWVSSRELWFLLVALPPLWLPGAVPALVPLSFALLTTLVLCRWITKRRPVPRTPMDWPILVILLMLPVGLWASPLPGTSWVVFCRILLGIALFYGLVGNVRTERQIALVMAVLVLGGVGIALLGLFASDWHTNKLPFLAPVYSYLPRISLPTFLAASADPQAGLFHPNMIGGALAILIPFDIALLGWYNAASVKSGREPSKQSPWLRRVILVALWLALVLMGSTLLLSQSRMGLVAVAVALFVWAALSHRWLWLAVPVGAVGLLPAARLLGASSPGEVLLRIPAAGTWYARPKLWRAALDAIRDYPFTGVGLGCFEPVVRYFYVIFIPAGWQFGHCHNLLLQAGVDLGIAGLLSFAALMGIGLHCGWKAWKWWPGGARWLAVGVVASLLVYVLFGTVDCLSLGSKPGFVFWIVLALLISLWQCGGRTEMAASVECRSLRELCDEQA